MDNLRCIINNRMADTFVVTGALVDPGSQHLLVEDVPTERERVMSFFTHL